MDNELKVIAEVKLDDLEIREPAALSKTAEVAKTADRNVQDEDSPASGKVAYGRYLDEAIKLLWEKANIDVSYNPNSRTAVERVANYYGLLDKAISAIVTSDVTASISDEQLDRLEGIRTIIAHKHSVILADVISKHSKPKEDECGGCGSLLLQGECVVCKEKGLVKEAGTPALQFYEDGFIVSLATDIVNYVVTSGFNLNEAIKTASESFDLSKREEYRLRKYLDRMGYVTPQIVWLPPAESRFA